MSIKTQGTQLYFTDISTSTAAIVKLACPTGITGLGGGGADEIDTTCLDADSRSFVRGLKNNGEISVPFIYDPTDNSHRDLYAALNVSENFQFCIGLSDNKDVAPTLDSNDLMVAPAARTSFIFSGYVPNVPLDFASNEVVRGTFTVKISGGLKVTYADGQTVTV